MTIEFFGAAIVAAALVAILRSKIVRAFIFAILVSVLGQILADVLDRVGIAITVTPLKVIPQTVASHPDVVVGVVVGAVVACILAAMIRK